MSQKFSGWIVRIYHNLRYDDTESWETFENHLQIGSHVDICNATEVIANHKLGTNLFAMTWRWVKFQIYLPEMCELIRGSGG